MQNLPKQSAKKRQKNFIRAIFLLDRERCRMQPGQLAHLYRTVQKLFFPTCHKYDRIMEDNQWNRKN